jgi:hypothetical protein
MSKWLEWVKTLNPIVGKVLVQRWERHATLIDLHVENYRKGLLRINADLIEEAGWLLGENVCLKEIEVMVSRYRKKLQILVERDKCEMVNYIIRNKENVK